MDIAAKKRTVDAAVRAAGRGIGERTHYFPNDRMDAGRCPVDHGGQVPVRAEKLADEIISVCIPACQPVQVELPCRKARYQTNAPVQICGAFRVAEPKCGGNRAAVGFQRALRRHAGKKACADALWERGICL